MQKMPEMPQLEGYDIVVDQNYNFDYAVYPKAKKDDTHAHSIALIKEVKDENAA